MLCLFGSRASRLRRSAGRAKFSARFSAPTRRVVAWRTHFPCSYSRVCDSASLLRRGRKLRQLVDIARVVLDDHGRLEVLLDLLDALDRGDGLGAVVVEARHAVR